MLVVQGIDILALVALVEIPLRTHANDLSILRTLRTKALNPLLVLNVLLTARASYAQIVGVVALLDIVRVLASVLVIIVVLQLGFLVLRQVHVVRILHLLLVHVRHTLLVSVVQDLPLHFQFVVLRDGGVVDVRQLQSRLRLVSIHSLRHIRSTKMRFVPLLNWFAVVINYAVVMQLLFRGLLVQHLPSGLSFLLRIRVHVH